MESNARFLLGVHLEDPTADPLVFRFQQELLTDERIDVQVSKAKAEALKKEGLVDALSTHYIQEFPSEEERIGREAVRRCIRAAIERWEK